MNDVGRVRWQEKVAKKINVTLTNIDKIYFQLI